MSKLHELIAVEADLKNSVNAFLLEAISTFTKKQHHFQGQNRTYRPVLDEGERFPDENAEMVTTVPDKLNWIETHYARYMDALLQKECTNTYACADLVIDGIVFAEKLPATSLLALENKFKSLREMYRNIPTLDPSERWVSDESKKNCYVSDTKETIKTAKMQRPLVLSPATDKHPAQVTMITNDETVGKWHTTKWSSMLSSYDKAMMLEKIDRLLEAVKQARCRANEAEIKNIELATKLFKYIRS